MNGHESVPLAEHDYLVNDDVPVKAECIHMIGCGCKEVATHSIRGDFCGQQQRRDAHVWTAPIPLGSTMLTRPRQCAGLSLPPGASS